MRILTGLRLMFSAIPANRRRFWSSPRMAMTSGSIALPASISPLAASCAAFGDAFRSTTLPPTTSTLVRPLATGRIAAVCAAILDVLENNRCYRNEFPYGEPQLGRRGLYHSTGGEAGGEEIMARLWVLNLSDGKHSLLDIAERSGVLFSTLCEAADLLCQKGLLSIVPNGAGEGTTLGEPSREDGSHRP